MNKETAHEITNSHGLLLHHYKIAFLISGIVLWSFIIGFTAYSISKPMVSTSYYHANIQFRAGKESSYEDIFNQSLRYILDMYYAHPSWKWSLECQGLLIEMAYNDYRDIFEKIKEQNLRNQLELIVPQYSHGLAVAYSYKDFAESINYTRWLLEDVYGLIVSDVIVLQEGQWLPAFPLINHFGFSTFIVSRDQLSYQNYYPKQPILTYDFAGRSGYVMPVPWLPLFEGGVYHSQLALSDSERINTGDIAKLPGQEFRYNPEKMAQIELRHEALEKMGNTFMTMAEWVQHCVKNGYTEPMGKFMPESHWTPNRHQSVSRWMAWGNSYTDDGIVLTRNVYTRNLIQTAEIMTQVARSQSKINDEVFAFCMNLTQNALKCLWLSEVTDTTGVNPNDYEFEYAINNTALAQKYANQVINYLRDNIPEWNNHIQVDSYHRQVLTQSNLFCNQTQGNIVETEADLEQAYGFSMNIEYNLQSTYPYSIQIQNRTYSARINDMDAIFQFTQIRINFTGARNIFINNTIESLPPYLKECDGANASEQHIRFADNWENITYSPSLAENYTRVLQRADYTNTEMTDKDFYLVPLPLCNGFIYNLAKGYAIITNNMVRHISVRWESSYLDFYENQLEYNSQYEFLIYEGYMINAHLLANLINCYPFWEVF